MSDRRLTDEELMKMQRIVDGDDGMRSIFIPWVNRAIAELRERRATELTAEDVEALQWLRSKLNDVDWCWSKSFVVLDRLLARGGK